MVPIMRPIDSESRKEIRKPDHPANSESLYQLRYLGHHEAIA